MITEWVFDDPKQVTEWRNVALNLYYRAHGTRCLVCSKPVSRDQAELFELPGDVYLLAHRECGGQV